MNINYILEDKHMKHQGIGFFSNAELFPYLVIIHIRSVPLSGTFVIFGDSTLRNYNSTHILGFFWWYTFCEFKLIHKSYYPIEMIEFLFL